MTPDDFKNACDARIRLADAIEVRCEEHGAGNPHRGVIRDYAYPGSETIVDWAELDRRTFHGEWPGRCRGDALSRCFLPVAHRGEHVS